MMITKSNRTESHLQNSDTMQAGQSLFEFLKRKKKIALQTSISKSIGKETYNINKENSNANSNKVDYFRGNYVTNREKMSPKQKYEETYRDTLRETVGKSNTNRNYFETQRNSVDRQKSSITPKKVTFVQSRQRRLSVRSSFIQMISPLKCKRGSSRTPQYSQIVSATRSIITSGKMANMQKQQSWPQLPFSRRNLNNSISTLKQTFDRYHNMATIFKQKSHQLFIELKPLLEFVQDSRSSFSSKANTLKDKMKSLQNISKEIVVTFGQDILDRFLKNFNQHLLTYESSLKSSFQKDKDEDERKLREHKDVILNQIQTTIAELQDSLNGASRQLSLTLRKLEKLESESQKQKQSSETSHYSSTAIHKQSVENLQSRIAQLQSELEVVVRELDECKQSQKSLQKQVKNYKYLKEEAQRRFIEQNMKIKSNREEFLLNEICMLKKEFQNDMQQLTDLYKAKQKQNLIAIEAYMLQLDSLHKQIVALQKIETELIDEISASKEKLDKQKKQNECLVTDLHRMNEELYQHWLALKDIRVLSNRLGILHKFGKIYEDLAYNDQLFK